MIVRAVLKIVIVMEKMGVVRLAGRERKHDRLKALYSKLVHKTKNLIAKARPRHLSGSLGSS